MNPTAKLGTNSVISAPKPTTVGLFYLLLATSSALLVFVVLYGHSVESSPANILQTDQFRQQQVPIRRLESGSDESEGDESIDSADSDHFLASSFDNGRSGRQSDNSAQSGNENSASEDDENFITGGNSRLIGDEDTLYATEPHGLGSNIANAKISVTPNDMDTAAGHHHHHHKHYVHGWLEMGAHTGKKGAFGWHDKHPVGGKGRR